MWQKPYNTGVLIAKVGVADKFSFVSSTLGWTIVSAGKNLLWKIKIANTPPEMAASAMLKTGLKKTKLSPPHIGNQLGKTPSSMMGK